MEESIQLLHGVLDNVRSPILKFNVINETDDYKEYIIETEKYSKEKNGEKSIYKLSQFIYFLR